MACTYNDAGLHYLAVELMWQFTERKNRTCIYNQRMPPAIENTGTTHPQELINSTSQLFQIRSGMSRP